MNPDIGLGKLTLEELTPEQIALQYSACLSSVMVIHDAISHPEKYLDDSTVIERNVRHLEGMRQKSFWTNENMTPIDSAISAGNAALVT